MNPVKALRLSLHLTQPQFAERLHVSTSYIAFIETGRSELTAEKAKLIQDAFGLEEGWVAAFSTAKQENMTESVETNPVKNLRKELGLSQEEFAYRVGMSVRMIWSLETGKKPITEEKWEKITGALQG